MPSKDDDASSELVIHAAAPGTLPSAEVVQGTAFASIKSTTPAARVKHRPPRPIRRLSHRRLARGRQARPPHRPRRDPRHAHVNANVRILHRRPLRAPTVTWGPQPVAVQRTPASAPKPTDSLAAAPTPTRPGSTTLTAPTVATLVPRSPPIASPQVGVLASCSASRCRAGRGPGRQRTTPSTPQTVSLSVLSGRTTPTLW